MEPVREKPIPPLPIVVTGVAIEASEVGEPLVDVETFTEGRVRCMEAYESGSNPEGCFVRRSVAEKLVEASAGLPAGFSFVILDAWRSLKMQRELFDAHVGELLAANPGWSQEQAWVGASRYVTNPYEVTPPHSTGGAIDITLASADGELVWGGSGFDEFSERSATRYLEEAVESGRELSDDERAGLENRRILFHALTGVGFTNYPNEWWHFDYGDAFWSQVTGQRPVYESIEPSS